MDPVLLRRGKARSFSLIAKSRTRAPYYLLWGNSGGPDRFGSRNATPARYPGPFDMPWSRRRQYNCIPCNQRPSHAVGLSSAIF